MSLPTQALPGSFWNDLRLALGETCRPARKLPQLVLLAMLFWFYSLSSYSISIDQEFAALQQYPEAWARQGRWFVHFLTAYILPQPVLPYFTPLVFCLSMALSYVLVLASHRLSADWKALAAFPVFAAYPVWYFIGEFYANLLSVSVSMVMVSAAVLALRHACDHLRNGSATPAVLALHTLFGIVLVGTATGAYQAFLLVYATMGLGQIVFSLLRPNPDKAAPWLRQLGLLAGVLIGAAVFYFAVSAVVVKALDIEIGYVDNFMKPELLLAAPVQVLVSTLQEVYDYYRGAPFVFGVSLWAAGLLTALGIATLCLSMIGQGRRHKGQALRLLLTAAACAVAPFGLQLMVGGGGLLLPSRTMIAVPYVMWLFAALALYKGGSGLRGLAAAALALLSLQMLHAHSTYNGARQLAMEHDKAMAGQVYERIARMVPDFDPRQANKIDFFGAKPFQSVFPHIPTTTIGQSFFSWDGGNPYRIAAFMSLIGYQGLETIPPDELPILVPLYADMPAWPAEDAIRKVGDTILVKLGPEAGHFHKQ